MANSFTFKKTLVALAALSATAAFADNEWSVYGTFDLGTRMYTREVTSAGATGKQDFTQTGGVNSSDYTNQLGIKFTRDIGEGNTVGGTLTWGMNPAAVSTGGAPTISSPAGGAVYSASNNSPFGQVREGYAFIAGGWGKVMIGSSNNLYQANAASSSTLQDVVVGGSFLSQVNGDGNSRGSIAMLNTAANHNGNIQVDGPYLSVLDGYTGIQPRYENQLTYWTPVMNGITGGVTVINTTTSPSGTALGTSVAKLNGSLLQVAYDSGPLSAHGAYLNITQETATAKRALTTAWAQGTYDFGVGTGWASYSTSQNSDQIGTSVISANALELGVRFPIGKWTPYAFIGQGSLTNSASFTSTLGAYGAGVTSTIGAGRINSSAFQLGTKYSLGKNAILWGGLGQVQFQNADNSDSDKASGAEVGVTLIF